MTARRSYPARPGQGSHAVGWPFPGDVAARAAALSLAANAFLLALKVVVGVLSGSIAVLSDGLDSAEDMVASGAAWLSVRIAARPADYDHPYGHGKVEGLSAALEAGVISAGGAFIGYMAVNRLLHGGQEVTVGLGLVAMAIALVIDLGAAAYTRGTARRTGSLALAAEARHWQVNLAQASVVLLGLGLVSATGQTLFDSLAALALVAFMGWSAFAILRSALNEIMDVRLPPAEEEIIRRSLLPYAERVRGYHGLRSRRSGRQRYIDLHLVVAPQSTVEEVHHICDRIEAEIREKLPGSTVSIHMEPDDGRYVEPMA